MRTPSKFNFIRSSLILAALLPNAASAEVTPEEAAKKSRSLSFEEAKKAFGPEFSAEVSDGTFTVYGVTTENCKSSNFDFSNDAKKGEFKIFYKGFNDDCLDFDKSKAAITAGEKSLALSSLVDSKMTGSSTFAALKLCSEDLSSDKNRVRCQELKNDKDETLGFESAADLAQKKKLADEEKRQGQIDIDLQLVTKCNRGLSELDVGAEALARLAKIPAVVEEKGDKYFTAAESKHRASEFAACRMSILRAATSDIDQTGCEERLKKISSADDKYVSKVKALYLELANRYMNSTTLGMEEAYEKALAAIEFARGLDLDEKETAELLAAERNLHINFLRLASTKGEGSQEFAFMKDKMLGFMLGSDDLGCLTDEGAVAPAQRMNRACAGQQWLAGQLATHGMSARVTQQRMNTEALIAQKKENDALKLGQCQLAETTKMTLTPMETAECTALKTQADKEVKSVVNAGLDGKGFGTIAEEKATTPAAGSADDVLEISSSGLMSSVYGDKLKTDAKPEVKTETKVAAPTAPAVTVNTVPMSQMRRVFR